MNQSSATLNFQDFIAAERGQLTTTSRLVAQVFGKRPDYILRTIRSLLAKLPKDRLHNFEETLEYRANPSGGAPISAPVFRMTRYGFTLIAMRFTGDKALKFQLAYLDAFDAMEALIRNQAIGIRFRLDEVLRAEADSRRRASLHGRGLRERRLEAPRLDAAIQTLQSKLQPMLPLFELGASIH